MIFKKAVIIQIPPPTPPQQSLSVSFLSELPVWWVRNDLNLPYISLSVTFSCSSYICALLWFAYLYLLPILVISLYVVGFNVLSTIFYIVIFHLSYVLQSFSSHLIVNYVYMVFCNKKFVSINVYLYTIGFTFLIEKIFHKINKLQGYILQHREYSKYFIITLNGV